MKNTLASILISFGLAGSASAAPNLSTQAGFDAFSSELGGAMVYRAVAPADPLGITGFDIAIEATNASFGGSATTIPKLKLQKGLPGNLDISGYYTMLPTASLVGADGTAYGMALSYAIWEGGVAAPALAIRGSYTAADIPGVITANTTGIDLTISKGITLLSPYAGIGLVNISTSDSTGTWNDYSEQATRYFFGANLNLKLFDIAFESGTTGSNQFTTFKIGYRF